MQIKIIRHCEPDYAVDSLTETGWKEDSALADYMERLQADYCFVSPLGRARDTAAACLARIGKTGETCEWLREFKCPVVKPDNDDAYGLYAWDWMPSEWTKHPAFFDKDRWMTEPAMADAGMADCYRWVTENLDALLAKHGYVRDGHLYRVEKPNHEVLVFFCHFGLECILLSHLLNISPMQLWHGTCAAPSSITTLATEERQQGIASWRMTGFGETPHLALEGIDPSFHARFCECYTDDTRH